MNEDAGGNLPNWANRSLFVNWRGSVAAGQVEGAKKRPDLGIIGHSDESALPLRAIKAVSPIQTVGAVMAAWRSDAAGTSAATTTAMTAGASLPAIGFDGQRTSLGIH